MDDLITWLRATIESDLAAARAIAGRAWRVDDESCGWFFVSQGEGDPLAKSCGCCSVGTLTREQAEHIMLQQPRDTIARCEAELAILDLHKPKAGFEYISRMKEEPRDVCEICCFESDWGAAYGREYPCDTIRLLAHGYRHRPGWQEGWAP